jgi:predicted permease
MQQLFVKVRSLLRNLFFSRGVEVDLDEEVHSHFEMLTEENIRAGMSPKEAQRAARLEIGGIEQVKERVREERIGTSLHSVITDCRFGLRQLRKNPGFTAVAALTLALGIGANTALFSIVDAVLLRPLPYQSADRLVAVWSTEIGQPGTKIFAPYRDFEEFQTRNRSFEKLAALTWARAGEILTWRGSPHEVLAIPASADFFSLLGVSAAQGRTFGPEDMQNGCTVVLAHSFWQNELTSASDIVGSTLTLNGKPCAVAGVMPKEFEFYPKQTALWTLITPDSEFLRKPFDSVVGIFGRLKPGTSITEAERELNALHERVVQQSPAGSWVAHTVPIVRDLREQFTWMAGRNLRTALLVLSAAVGLVLVIACLNVANLLIGRFVERQRELAVRAALGSGRSRLMRQLLVESLLLATLGALAGVLFAVTGVHFFNSANPIELPPGNPVGVNLRVLGFTTFLATVTGLIFGLVPAWRASEVDLNEVLKQSSRSVTYGKSHRASRGLVVGQVTLSLVLLAGAGLLIESIVRLGSVPLGFRPDHLLTAEVALPHAAYSDAIQRVTFYRKLIGNLGVLPGLEGVALCSSLPPYNGGASSELAVAGRVAIENLEAVNSVETSSGYFHVLGIPLLRGREFDSRDREESQRVAIVNDEMARKYFPKEDPMGQQIKLGKADAKVPWLTIIGVVGNEKRTIVYQEMGYVEPALVYLPVEQSSAASMGLVMRVAANPLVLSPILQREVSHLDSGVPVYDVRTMTDRYSEFLAHPRFRAIIMGIVAGLTLLLAAVGVYGVLAQSVSQRTQEIGVRLALGAHRQDILRLILGQGTKLTLMGVGIGTIAALALTRLMSSLLFRVSPIDPLTFASVIVLLTFVALLASYIPARRAIRVDPMIALRYE